MTPNPILRAAITASGHSSRGFAEHMLRVDERTVRRYLRGDWPVPGPVAQLCRAVLRDETLAAWLAPAEVPAQEVTSRPDVVRFSRKNAG